MSAFIYQSNATTLWELLPALIMTILLLVAALWDARERRIPNQLTLGSAIVGLALNGLLYGTDGLLSATKGWGLGLVLLLILWLVGAMGAGDVKLLAAVGALMGPVFVINTFLWMGLAGGVLAIAISLQRRQLRVAMTSLFVQLNSLLVLHQVPKPESPKTSQRELPYGVAIAIGGLAALFWAWI
jgi:prepilin peptidase CpaA